MRNSISNEIASISLDIGKIIIVVYFLLQGQTYSVEDEMCVPRSQCGCYFREEYYKPGDSRQHRCNTCTCENGHWSCTKHNCSGNLTSQSELFNNCANTSFRKLEIKGHFSSQTFVHNLPHGSLSALNLVVKCGEFLVWRL